MATETLPSGNFVVDIRRTEGRWRLSLGTSKKRIATQRKAMLMALADSDEGRAILDQLKARALKIDDVERALAPGGKGVASLRAVVGGMTIREACDAFLVGFKGRDSTRKVIESVVTHLVRDLGASTPIARVTKGQAQKWLYRKEWSASTQKQKRIYARLIFAEAKLRENVWEEVKAKKEVDREMSILSSEETHEFLEQLDVKHRAWMACGFLAGLRIGESCNLRWQDVDHDAGVLHVRNRGGAYSWVTKNGKSRVVDAPPELFEYLDAWRRKKNSRCEYVFGMHLGPLAATTGALWAKQAYESAGMVAGRADDGWTYHAGRHSAASNALRAGVPPSIVAKWIGNTVAVLLETYSHVLSEDTSAVAEALRKKLHS